MRSLIFVLLMVALSGCDSRMSGWVGHVYPDRTNLRESIYLGTFDSLDHCRVRAWSLIDNNPDWLGADYECGRGCRIADYSPSTQPAEALYVCKEVAR